MLTQVDGTITSAQYASVLCFALMALVAYDWTDLEMLDIHMAQLFKFVKDWKKTRIRDDEEKASIGQFWERLGHLQRCLSIHAPKGMEIC